MNNTEFRQSIDKLIVVLRRMYPKHIIEETTAHRVRRSVLVRRKNGGCCKRLLAVYEPDSRFAQDLIKQGFSPALPGGGAK